MGSIILSGLRDQNNGKKIGINGSRIYHVTTLKALLSRHASQQCEKYRKRSPYRHFSFVVLVAILEMWSGIFMVGTS